MTISHFIERGWRVRARCLKCPLTIAVDLKAVAFYRGPKVNLWDRKQPCKSMTCEGEMVFDVHIHPRRVAWDELCSPGTERQIGKIETIDGKPGSRPVCPADKAS